MADKQRGRNWTPNEVELFAKILSDEEDNFAESLEKLALKKHSNNEVFTCIKLIFDRERKKNEFIEENERVNFMNKKGAVTKYAPLDTSLAKLRRKYKCLKSDWRKISDKAKKGSGLAPEKEENWYKLLNPIFTETNESLELTENSNNLSFTIEEEEDEEENDDDEKNESEGDEDDADGAESIPDAPADSEEPVNIPKGKLVVAPHKKRGAVRSQNQVLSQMAKGLGDLASSQIKKAKMMIEADRKRDELFLKYKQEEAERNREHEIRLAQIYASNNRPTRNISPSAPANFPLLWQQQQQQQYSPMSSTPRPQSQSYSNFMPHAPHFSSPNSSGHGNDY